MIDIPYFKFFVSEWQNGDIAMEEYHVQGVFVDLISYYWASECKLEYDKMIKKYRREEDSIKTLIESGIIKIHENMVVIKFLDDQLIELSKYAERQAAAGRKGGLARAAKYAEEKQATLKQPLSDPKATLEGSPKQSLSDPQALKERKGKERKGNNILVDKIYDRIRLSIKNHKDIERDRTKRRKSIQAIEQCLKVGLTEDDICRYWNNYLNVKKEADELIAGFGNHVKPEEVLEWKQDREARAEQKSVKSDRAKRAAEVYANIGKQND